ncbi:alcohol dehydrogenase [Coprinopsis cinerea okayama7|uniref:Alcohol dehydrogenase n=1 Tax=Coprinopsis cinerea (strain Okayama-7 / 130 / ATCC MYA-4618 / FGSC 9003) TaxID=240176 RepID=A8NUH8_COPC7|nr:alcohol dehydrogenase [Coprinopsis cinerea okayama7\|eukprot:XP_001836462.1 alcohol dehydrogenase [Coprinopsis cinerea okayama7\
MAPSSYKQIVLNSRPVGDIEPDTFRTEVRPASDLRPGPGQALVQCTWLSLDPAMRGYIRDVRSYLPPVQIGEVMRAAGLGVVVAVGPGSKFQVGDYVSGQWGMREFAVVKDKHLEKLELGPGIEALDYLGVLGGSGLTAYFGLKEIGQLKAGDKLVVSGAAGSVGTVACQLGKAAGAKVYAIAGGPAKCRWLEEEIGVEKAFDYKSPSFFADVKKHVGYLDVYFDNVGGDILDFLLTRLNKDARIVLCGAISAYNSPKPKGLQSYLNLISQRATLRGFILFDYEHRYPEALAELRKGLQSGAIKRKFHIVEGGIEQAPKALPMLFSGGNTGKLVVKVSDEPKAQAKL